MKIMPLYVLLKGNSVTRRQMGSFGRKSMALVLEGNEVFPVGTPNQFENCTIYHRGMNHFHTMYLESGRWYQMPAGQHILDNVAVVNSKRLGRGRQVLRRLLANYPPVDKCQQAHELRKLVREGD